MSGNAASVRSVADNAASVALWDDLTLEQKVERLQYVVSVLSAWLVQAQTGFGKQDYDGIQNLIHHGSVSRAAS